MRFNPATSDLAGIPRPTLEQWLREAQTALHELSIGGKVEAAAYTQGEGSKSITFTRGDMAQLRAHIAALKAQLGVRDHSRRAIRPYFGR
jgi:hypothetical protein